MRQQCFVFRGLQIFDFSQQQVLNSSALWQSIVGWESSRKSSGCLPEPRGSRCPSFSNSLSLSLSLTLAGLFINLGKICKSPSLSQLSYIIQLYSAKSQRRRKLDKLGTTDLSEGFRFEPLFAEHNHSYEYFFFKT